MLRKISINLFAVENSHESDYVVFDLQSNSKFADSDPVIPAFAFQFLEVWNLGGFFSLLNVRDCRSNTIQQTLIFYGAHIFEEALAKDNLQ